MGIQSGRNFGVVGLLDIDASQTPVKMILTARDIRALLSAAVHDITGPGSNYNKQLYTSNVGGGITVDGEIRSDQRPFPPTLHNFGGTLTLQFDTNCTGQMPVLISELACSKHEKTQNMWVVKASFQKNGAFVQGWNGSAFTYTQPTMLAQEKFAGSSRTYDPNNLQEGAALSYFIPIVASGTNSIWSNISLNASATAFVASLTAPQSNLHPTVSTLERLDDSAAFIDVHWHTRDTKGEIEKLQTHFTSDASSLNSHAEITLVNGTLPTLTGLILRSTHTQSYDDINLIVKGDYGLRSTEQDRTLPGTSTIIDFSSLHSTGRVTIITNTTASFTAPAGLVIRDRITHQITGSLGSNNRYETVFNLGLRTMQDDVTLPGTHTVTDYGSINNAQRVTVVSNGTASYSAPAGLKIVDSVTHRMTTALGTADWYETVFTLSTKDTIDRLTFPGTHSSRAGITPFRDSTSNVITTGSVNTATLSNYLWTAFQGTPFAHQVHARPLIDGKFLAVYEYLNPGALVRVRSAGGARRVAGMSSGGTASIWCTSNLAYDSSRRLMTFSPTTVYGSSIRSFVLFRQFSSNGVPEQNPDTINGVTLPSYGQTNIASFLNVPAGQCIYDSIVARFNLGLTSGGAFPVAVGYRFHTDTLGFVGNLPDDLFSRAWPLMTSDTNTSQHWANTSLLNLPGVVIPTKFDFSAFTSGV